MSSTEAQRQALAHVASKSVGEPVQPSSRVTLHFHPDRLVNGVPILKEMRQAGRYKSQFETSTSNGGLTAHPGGDRWLWESRLFGGAYDNEPSENRPVYGSLNFRNHRIGGSPRFGSAYFRLSAEVLDWTTLCFPDSVFEPVHVGVPKKGSSLIREASTSDLDFLDSYIEAHVHVPGGVQFESKVDALVLDPCFRGTEVEREARLFPVEVEWHPGFRLSIDQLALNPDYRGREVVEFGKRIAQDGWLDARIIGETAMSTNVDPQVIKKVWHCVARFGVLERGLTATDLGTGTLLL